MIWAKEILKSEEFISNKRKEKWQNECFRPFDELSEEMKELDRNFARNIINKI